MAFRRFLFLGLCSALALTACPAPNSVPPTDTSDGNTPKKLKATEASASPMPSETASPQATATPSITPTPVAPESLAPLLTGSLKGVVLGLDDKKPIAGILVSAQIITNNGGAIVGDSGGAYRLSQASALTTTTDKAGRFSFEPPVGKAVNIEARQTNREDVKAISLVAKAGDPELSLQLSYTGQITGKLTAPADSGITNFEGIDVFIPGTSYAAKSASDGTYTLSNVPVGSFGLVASRAGTTQRGEASGVAVKSKEATTANVAMTANGPKLLSVSPNEVRAGDTLTLVGERFGKTTGTTFAVSVGGAVVPTGSALRLDDTKIEVKVPNGANTGKVDVTVGGEGSSLDISVLRDISFAAPVTTLGGNNDFDFADGGPSSSRFNEPRGVTFSADGKGLFVADSQNKAIRYIDRATKTTKTIAGALPPTGDFADWDHPTDLVLAPDGSLYVADEVTHSIYKVSLTGTGLGMAGSVTLYAGAGEAGDEDGSRDDATFNTPKGIDVDAVGNLYIADSANNKVRQITPAGEVKTFAGSGVDGGKNANGKNAQFENPVDVAVGSDGVVYVLENLGTGSANRIRQITPSREVSSLVPGRQGSSADGDVFGAGLWDPSSIAWGRDGSLYVTDNDMVSHLRRIKNGVISIVAGGEDALGNGDYGEGIGRAAPFSSMGYIAVDKRGNVAVTDPGLRTQRVCEVTIWTTTAP